MPMSFGRRLLAVCVLAGFGVGLALLTVELGVRMLHLVPSRFWEPDAILGTKLIPGKQGWWTQEEHEFTVPVQATLTADHWTGTAKFSIPFIDWGLKNPSNWLLKVEHAVTVELELKGTLQNPAPQ